MLYRPCHDRLWDTWLVHDAGLWHLFYIRISRDHPGLWNGISLATSSDLVHFSEQGPILDKTEIATWLGTGMVTRAGTRWIMNYSEELPGEPPIQGVGFAESSTLTAGWKRISNVRFEPDPRFYESAAFLGFLTANALNARRGASGTVGMAESDDAVHWRALPPPLPPGMFTNCEVVEHCAFGRRHYLTFCTNTGAGIRFDPHALGGSGGTHYVVADAIEGPYHPPCGDSLLQGTRRDDNVFALTVGRPVPDGAGGWLYSHHWASPNQSPSGWWGPVKRLVERGPWQLGLDWWKGNECLKGTVLGDGVTPLTLHPVPPFFRVPVVRWEAQGEDLRILDEGGCGAAVWCLPGMDNHGVGGAPTDLRDGRLLECGVRISHGAALGVWFGTVPVPGLRQGPAASIGPRPEDFRLGVLLNAEHGRVEFLKLMRCLGPSLVVQQHLGSVPWPIVRGVTHRLRVLVRREFIEAYVDDRYAHGVVIGEGFDTSRVGFVGDRAEGRIARPTLWRME